MQDWLLFVQTATVGRPDYPLPDARTSVGRVIVVKVPPGRALTIVVGQPHQLIDGSPTYQVASGEAAAFQPRDGQWYVLATYSVGVPAHAFTHENGGSDEINVTGLSGLLADAQTPLAHAASHQDGGSDEISVTNLSGQLADAQKVTIRRNSGGDVGTRSRLNLIEGANVTLTVADDAGGQEVDITIASSGGGGGASATTVEQDLGSTPTWRGRFTITDAAIGAASKVLCWQAPGPYTGKGTRADEAEMQPVSVVAVDPAAGSAVVYWETPPIVTMSLAHTTQGGLGEKKDSNVVGGTGQMYFDRYSGYQQIPKRLGKVRGDVKFSYVVFS